MPCFAPNNFSEDCEFLQWLFSLIFPLKPIRIIELIRRSMPIVHALLWSWRWDMSPAPSCLLQGKLRLDFYKLCKPHSAEIDHPQAVRFFKRLQPA